MKAARVSAPPQVDGRLDESDWARAVPVADFYQRQRNEGLPATERTEVRVLFDDAGIYIGLPALRTRSRRRSAPGRIFRDEAGGADDLVSRADRRLSRSPRAIQFVTNRNGLIEDLLSDWARATTTRNHDFDSHLVFDRAGRLPEGFEVEVPRAVSSRCGSPERVRGRGGRVRASASSATSRGRTRK